MALQTKLIKQKMRSVANIGKITETMEMISVSKMKKSVYAAQSSKEYTQSVFNILNYIAKQKHLQYTHELLKKRQGFLKGAFNRRLVIIVASDKGLCGSYNLNIYKKVIGLEKKYGANTIDCVTVGKYAEKMAVRAGFAIKASFEKISVRSAEEEARIITNVVIDHFRKNPYENVLMLYTNFIKASEFKPSVKDILPIDGDIMEEIIMENDLPYVRSGVETIKEEIKSPDSEKELFDIYLFEPNEAFVLDIILPKLVRSIIYQAMLESLASEHSARMFAMKNASDNASNIYKELKGYFNRSRQESITKELSEIVSGASAL